MIKHITNNAIKILIYLGFMVRKKNQIGNLTFNQFKRLWKRRTKRRIIAYAKKFKKQAIGCGVVVGGHTAINCLMDL